MNQRMRLFVCLICAALMVGCQYPLREGLRPSVTLLVPDVGNGYSIAQEQKLGKEQLEEMRVDKGVIFVEDAEIDQYLRELVTQLQACLSGDYPHIPAQILIVRGDSERLLPGAMSIAGGYMFLRLEKLSATKSEDMLVAQISHELGHVELRHATHWETQRKTFADYVETISTGQDNSSLAGVYKELATYLRILEVQFEDEADLFAVRLALRSGYDPHDYMVYIAEEYSYPASLTLLNRHRPGDERAMLMEAEFQRIKILNLEFCSAKQDSASHRFFAVRERATLLLGNE